MNERERAAFQALIEEWAGANRQLPPVLARVVRSGSTSAGQADALQPRYTVDVQVLAADGSDAAEWPVLHEVPLDVIWAGPGVGVWALPAKAAIVRVGWYYGDPRSALRRRRRAAGPGRARALRG